MTRHRQHVDHRARSRRPPAFAGLFYEADADSCAADAARLCTPLDVPDGPTRCVGAMLPHAAWAYSGRVAGNTLATLAQRTDARSFVLTGTVHTVELDHGALDTTDAWSTPLGDVAVDHDLRTAVQHLNGFERFGTAHANEHSLEVQLPLMQSVFGEELRIVPCLIPPIDDAVHWGQALGELLRDWPTPVGIVVSSDLTHYGSRFRFTPHGIGDEGFHWAHDVNDRALLERVERLAATEILPHTREHRSACGGGAIAATLAACRALGATRGHVLMQTSSREISRAMDRDEGDNSVGYAGVLFGS